MVTGRHSLNTLLLNGVKWNWRDKGQDTFQILRNLLITNQYTSKEYYVLSEASKKKIRAVLKLAAETGIVYHSRVLKTI